MKKTAKKTTSRKVVASTMSLGAAKHMRTTGLKRTAKKAMSEVERIITPAEGNTRRKGAARSAMPLSELASHGKLAPSGRRGTKMTKGATVHDMASGRTPKIEKGIPLSDTPQRRSWDWVKQMGVGDSFLLEAPRDSRQGGSIATRLQSLTGYTFTTRKKGDAVRVHRVA